MVKKRKYCIFLQKNGISKLLSIMRLSILLTIVGVLQANANGISQVFTISGKKVTIKEIVSQIEKSSNYKFLYQDEVVDGTAKVDIEVYKQPIEVVLDHLLANSNLGFKRFDDNLIVLTKASSEAMQTITVKGTIVSALNGEPLPGASIVIKGTTLGTVTDIDGKYSIDVQSADAVLLISSIGFLDEEIAVNGRTTIDITLSESIESLEEVIVVGYGTQRKSDLTGSIASVKAEDLKSLPVKSLAEALTGRVAGVFVTKGTGEPGKESDIFIRGATSINNIKPLYIVDGQRMGTGNNFNMSDVESIEILKDASSAAIYGVEAAGGVILVTTKKGRRGEKMNVEFNTYLGQRKAINLPELLNRKDYIRARNIMGVQYASWDASTTDTDWINEMYKPAVEQSYNLSLSGGNEKSTYYISAGYLKEDGIRRKNSFDRMSVRMNSDYKLHPKLKVGEFLYISKTSWRPTGDGSDIPYRSIPMMAVYDETRAGGWGAAPDGFQGTNHVGSAEARVYDNSFFGVEGSFFAEWNIIKGLNLRSTVGGYSGGDNTSQFDLIYDFGIIKNGVRKLTKELKRDQNALANFVLTYDKAFGKHELKAMAGWEAIKDYGTNVFAKTEGFPVDYTPSFGLSTMGKTSREADAGYSKGSKLAQFGRLNYNYAGKYILQATVRRDGTNKFIGENTYGVFPSFSAAWRFSEEGFMKDKISWLSNAKLRGGWGVLGSIGAVKDFVYEDSYGSINAHSFDGTNAVTGWGSTKFANKNIKWEQVTTTNVALEFGLFNNKLTLEAEWYDKLTTDMLYDVALPPSSGIGNHNGEYNATINIGEIQNRGFEFVANWRDKVGDLSYGISGNASFGKNKVLRLGDEGSVFWKGGTAWTNGSLSKTEDGYSIGQFNGYIVDGIFQTDADAAASAQPKAKAGDLIYRDINSKGADGKLTGTPDNKIDDADKTYIGNPWPKCIYGFNFDFEFKGFDMRIFMQGLAGVDIFNATKGIRQNFYADYNTTSDIFNTSYFGNTKITDLPRTFYVDEKGEYLRDPNGNYKNPSSFFVESGAYLKLKNLQIGYTLPKSLSTKVGMQSARVYVSGYNLLTFTKYTGLDPELGGDVSERGIENAGLYPQTRLISVGLDIKF